VRAFLAIVLPLALPTALYVFYMALIRRRPGAANAPAQPIEIPWSWLIIAGGVLVAVTFVALYVFEDAGRGKYHPAQTIDGRIKPGYFDDKSN
jgi:ABC-type sulfate transport system permease component